jgi:hypothetical protein
VDHKPWTEMRTSPPFIGPLTLFQIISKAFLSLRHARRSCHATWNSLRPLSLPLSDACRPSPWLDALSNRRALSEQSELARPPVTCVRPLSYDRAGRHWFWLLLPPHKGFALRDEPSDSCALRDAPGNKLGCWAETRHIQFNRAKIDSQ